MEIWKEIPNYSPYMASNIGRIKNNITDNILKPILDKNNTGYLKVNMSIRGKPTVKNVHCLITTAFIGVKSKGICVNHIDYNKLNNNIENLEYVSYGQNIKHSWRDKNRKLSDRKGEKHPMAILTNKSVFKIRKMYSPRKITSKILSEIFNVSQGTINDVIRRKSWRHI